MAAMAGNCCIAVLKLVAAGLSGSVAMMAEGIHSIADTANQALLLLGLTLSRKSDPSRYPLGRAKEVYFWAFVVALVLFFLGGVYAIYEGVHKLLGAHEAVSGGPPWLAWGVLVGSAAFEGASFFVAWREFNKSRGRLGFDEALFQGKDPTIPIVLLEDMGALTGLVLALVAVTTSWLMDSVVPDALGSIVIGLLLCAVGAALARDTRSLLIGEGVTPAVRQEVLSLASATEGVEAVTQLISYHLGPETVLLALKVRFRRDASVADVEQITDRIEARIREAHPQMKRIFVEADGRYDERLDPALRTAESES